MSRSILIILFAFIALQANAQSEPRISFGGIEHNRKTPVTINGLLHDPRIIATGDSLKVFMYQVMIKSNASGMMVGPFKVQGARITQEVIDALKANRKGGGSIYFEEIVVVGADKRPRKYNDLIYKYSN